MNRDFSKAFKRSSTVPVTSGPLRDGADVSWIPYCRIGDDQGMTSACVIFSLENWSTIVGISRLGNENCDQIPDRVCIEAYNWAIGEFGLKPGDGLTYAMGLEAAKLFGFFDPDRTGLEKQPEQLRLVPVEDLSPLVDQPLLGGFDITQDDMTPTPSGQILDNHEESLGAHAQVIIADGMVDEAGERFVYREQSWGRNVGWNGMTFETHERFKKRCFEIWKIV